MQQFGFILKLEIRVYLNKLISRDILLQKGFQTGYVTTNTADMYIHGLTEEEIVEYIKNQELELYYVNKLNNKSEHVKLKDMKNVEVEFKERDR